jgi:RND family efflux transporter MFP subunit
MTKTTARLSFAILAFLVVVGGGFSLWAGAPESASATSATKGVAPVHVTVSKVTVRPVDRRVTIVGSLYGKEEIPVSSEVGGRVIRIHHDIGDPIGPGELLFEIDPREYELAVNESRRALEWELAKLGLKEPPASDDEVAIDKLPVVVKAKAQLDLSEQVHRRAAQLRAQKTISQDEWDKAEAELKLNTAAYEQAILDARTILAAVRQKQAMLETALERLGDTKVTAPTPNTPAGSSPVRFVIAERSITEGEILASARGSEPAFRLVISDPLKLQAAVAERFASEIKKDQEAGLTTEATGPRIFTGKVSRVHPTVDRASRTFQVEIEVPNGEGLLPPGAFARCAVVTRPRQPTLTVPAESIVKFAGVVKLFLIRDQASLSVPVKIGERIEVPSSDPKLPPTVWFEVSGELRADETVVVTGQSQLADGTPVAIRTPPESVARSAGTGGRPTAEDIR